MFLKQIEVGKLAVFAYLIGGDDGGDGLVVDPSDEIDRILRIAQNSLPFFPQILYSKVSGTYSSSCMWARLTKNCFRLSSERRFCGTRLRNSSLL